MTRIVLNFGLCLALCGALAFAASGCPDKNGRYAVSGQCDAYTECIDGVPEEKLCPDGLLFNDKSGLGYPCGYPIEVNCEQRTKTQNAQPTEECPHQFGYYRMGDASHCGQFMNCAGGKGFILDCPDGLAWNSATYQCDWPDLVEDCDSAAFLGFKCPEIAKSELLGQEEYRFYPSPQDCQHFFLCINGQPRLNNCGEGQGFNVETNACDGLENITCSGSSPVRSQPIKQAPSRAAPKPQQGGSSFQQPAKQQAQRGGAFSNSYQQPAKPQQQPQRGQQQNTGRQTYG